MILQLTKIFPWYLLSSLHSSKTDFKWGPYYSNEIRTSKHSIRFSYKHNLTWRVTNALFWGVSFLLDLKKGRASFFQWIVTVKCVSYGKGCLLTRQRNQETKNWLTVSIAALKRAQLGFGGNKSTNLTKGKEIIIYTCTVWIRFE